MRKIFSLFAILAAFGIVLAGCSGSEKQDAPKSNSFSPDPNADAAKGN